MKKPKSIIYLLLLALSTIITNLVNAATVIPAPNGITYPTGLKNWRVLSTSYRTDNDTQRVILGNSIAINAAKTNQTKPWPKGSILAKLVWKNIQHPKWDTAIVPGEFVHSEIMIKDAVQYKSTGGWGYARWQGKTQQPYGKDSSFAQECFSCHSKVRGNDYVFTLPAKIP